MVIGMTPPGRNETEPKWRVLDHMLQFPLDLPVRLLATEMQVR